MSETREITANIKAQMTERIDRAFDAWDNRSDLLEFKINRLVLPLGDVEPLLWLANQKAECKMFWSGRDDDIEIAGVGIADLMAGSFRDHPNTLIENCRKYLDENPSLRYFGGFAFQEESNADPSWQKFGASRFHVPRFEVVRTGGVSSFICNIIFKRNLSIDKQELLEELNTLELEKLQDESCKPTVVKRSNLPDEMTWSGNVLSALNMMEHELLEKVVLARRVDLQCTDTVNPVTLLRDLSKTTHDVYHFCLQPQEGSAFIGATPERLIQRKDKWAYSEAVAGTRPRGNTPENDDVLAQQLLTSRKDHLEHDIVRKSIRQRMHLLCDNVQVDESARLLRLSTKQHLFSALQGRIRKGVTDGDLIDSLHPTPAVGGYPTENALVEIQHLEPFCRGWYAAPVGWISRDAAEFAVAIRSALVENNRLSLYSGAGIVHGSKPDDEWDEIENKVSDYLALCAMP